MYVAFAPRSFASRNVMDFHLGALRTAILSSSGSVWPQSSLFTKCSGNEQCPSRRAASHFEFPKVSEAGRVCIPHLDSDHEGIREGQSNASALSTCRSCWIEIIAKSGKWSCHQYHGGMIFRGSIVRGAVGGCAYGEVFRISEAVVLDFGPQVYPPR